MTMGARDTRILCVVFRILLTLCLSGASISQGIRNPGFEQSDAWGNPAEWMVFREGFVDDDPALARSGTRSVRSSAVFGWAQDIPLFCSPLQTFAIIGYAQREFPFEQARTRCMFRDSTGQYLPGTYSDSPLPSPIGYQPFWTTHLVPPDADSATLYLAGKWSESWVRFDDLDWCTEQLTSTRWLLSPGASIFADELTLVNAGASQDVATGSDGQQYFVAGRHTTAGGATLRISDTWLPRGAAETTRSIETTVPLAPGSSWFVADFTRPREFSTGKSRIDITTSETATLRYLKRGFAKAEPTTLTIGANSPDSPLAIAAAVPDFLLTASVSIQRPDLTSFSLPVELLGTSIRSNWTPASAPAGTYRVVFDLVCEDSQTIHVERPFSLAFNGSIPATTQPFHRDAFTRCAWLFFLFDETTETIDQSFSHARADGFDFAKVQCRADQLVAVKEAATRENLPFFADVSADTTFRDYLNRNFFSMADYAARLEATYADVTSSPLFRGIYLTDEPHSTEQRELVRRANLALTQSTTLQRGWTVATTLISPSDHLAMLPPVMLVDLYPFNESQPDNQTALLTMVPQVNSYATAAGSTSRDLWLVCQGFEMHDEAGIARPVAPKMHWGQLGAAVLAGARGVVPFTYNTINHLQGLRDPDFQETLALGQYRRFNELMTRIGETLVDLSIPTLATAPPPFAVSTAQTTTGSRVVMVLNADEHNTRSLAVTLSSPPIAPVTDLVTLRPVPVTDLRILHVALGPGEWAVIETGAPEIESFAGDSVQPPEYSSLSLPQTHAFTVTSAGGAPQPVLAISLNENATRVACTVPFSYVAEIPHVYDLQPAGTVTRRPWQAMFPAQRAFFQGDDVALASPYLGLRLIPAADSNGTPRAKYVGHSGGAYATAQTQNFLWVTTHDFGIRQLIPGSGTLQAIASGLSDSNIYMETWQAGSSDSVLAAILNTGVDLVSPGALDETSHSRSILRRTQGNGSINSSGLLAIPRHGGGVALLQTAPTPALRATLTDELVETMAVAWLNNSVLAVADGPHCVRFFRVSPTGSATRVGIWRPSGTQPVYLRSLASKADRLAVGLQDGRVIVLDVSSLTAVTAAQPEWTLYE